MPIMKASELRIGNWVMDRGDKIWQIHSWDSYEKVCANPPFLGDSDLGQITGHPLTEYVDYLKPIPLTEEWLLKFGFEKQNDGINSFILFNHDRGELLFSIAGSGSTWYRTTDTFPKLNCVHTLQNLYFALTGEELTIK